MRYALPGALIVAAFVFWHSGGRGAAVCEREVFTTAGSFSLWPPGTRCEYGLPVQDGHYLNLWFFATAFVIVMIVVLDGVVRSRG
jgi:hypothetical protein